MDSALRYLIVDDDPIDAESARRNLTEGGSTYTVADIAPTLQAAKARIREGRYDLLVADLGLPDSQGIDSVIELQATAPEIPLIVITGNRDAQLALRAVGVGAEDFISKDSMATRLAPAALFAIERHRKKREMFYDFDGMRHSLDDAMLQAQTDALTGMPNRRGLEWHLERLSRARFKQPLIVGLVDMDKFKSINDSYGHDVGDAVLSEFSSRLQLCLRSDDFAARVGGDEFVLVLGGMSREDAELMGQSLLNRLASEPFQAGGHSITFSATVAMAELELPFVDVEQILQKNHEMMARAKNEGRARLRCSWGELDEALRARPYSSGLAEAWTDVKFVQFNRPIIPFGEAGEFGQHLNFSLAKEGPLRTPAFSRARISGKMAQLTLQMMKKAAQWRRGCAPGETLHLDMEAEALKPWMIGEMNSLFPSLEERSRTCLFFATDFVARVGSDVLMQVRLLRQAGFQIGVRGIGDGATVLEHLMMMEPTHVRIGALLTSGVARYAEKARQLERLVGTLWLLEARILAEEINGSEDMQMLDIMGLVGAYGATERVEALEGLSKVS